MRVVLVVDIIAEMLVCYDIEIRPDGYVHVLSFYEVGNNYNPIHVNGCCISYTSPFLGTILRIVPTNTPTPYLSDRQQERKESSS